MMQYKPQPLAPSFIDAMIWERFVPEDHPLRLAREQVDFSFVNERLAHLYHPSNGRPAYSPELLSRLTFLQIEYGWSDRRVILEARTSAPVRYFVGLLLEDDPPHPSLLPRYRDRVGEEGFKDIFGGIFEQAESLRLVESKRVLIDSYTIEADISVPGFRRLLDRIITRALRALEGTPEIADTVEQLRREHGELAEDKSYQLGPEQRRQLLAEWLALAGRVADLLEARDGERSPQQSKALELLEAALERAENHDKRNIKKDDILSDVDPDARWSRKGRGRETKAGYQQQLAVEADSGFVTNVETNPGNVDDSEVLQSVLAGHIENVGGAPEEVVTDSKYQSGENRAYLKSEGIGDFIAAPATKGSKQGHFSASDLQVEWNEQMGEPLAVVCPNGQRTEKRRYAEGKHAWVFTYSLAQCRGCPLRDKCMSTRKKKGKNKQPSRERARQWSVDQHFRLMREARARQESEAGKAAQIARLDIERRFSYQKRRGGNRARYRGLAKNRMWGWMWAIWFNVRQIMSIRGRQSKEAAAQVDEKLYTSADRPGSQDAKRVKVGQ